MKNVQEHSFFNCQAVQIIWKILPTFGRERKPKGVCESWQALRLYGKLGFSCCCLSSLFMRRCSCSLVRSWTWWSSWVPFIWGYSMILWPTEVLDQIHWKVAVLGWCCCSWFRIFLSSFGSSCSSADHLRISLFWWGSIPSGAHILQSCADEYVYISIFFWLHEENILLCKYLPDWALNLQCSISLCC